MGTPELVFQGQQQRLGRPSPLEPPVRDFGGPMAVPARRLDAVPLGEVVQPKALEVFLADGS